MKTPWLVGMLGLLLLALILSTLLAQQQAREFVPLTTYSTQPNGARALALWLEELGYGIERVERSPYEIGPELDVLFLLEPSLSFEPLHLEALREWVAAGGTLVLAGNQFQSRPIFQHFGIGLLPVAPAVELGEPAQPLFPALPVRQTVFRTPDVLETDRPAAVPWLRHQDRWLAASLQVGEGRVVALASPYPLTNQGLGEGDNGALALYLVALGGPDATLGFDEYHHGFIRRHYESPLALALSTPWGWALAYAGLALGLYLVLSGRRFGRAVPLRRERSRNLGEYVRSMAGLYRRARQRRFVAQHAAQQLRRRLARHVGLDPELPLAAMAEWLRVRGMPNERLVAVLGRLEGEGKLSEPELLALVQEGDRLVGSAVGPDRASGLQGR